jgi:hypothetical protein
MCVCVCVCTYVCVCSTLIAEVALSNFDCRTCSGNSFNLSSLLIYDGVQESEVRVLKR